MKHFVTIDVSKLYQQGIKWYDCPQCRGHRKLGITDHNDYLVYHCFKCGIKGKQGKIKYRKSLPTNKYIGKVVQLPDKIQWEYSKFKPSVQAYLFKYGITSKDVQRYGIMSVDHCLLTTVTEGNHVVKYQQRDVRTKDIYQEYVEGYAGIGKLTELEGDKRLVIVEDPVSAMKVSRQFSTLCIFGTRLSDKALSQIIGYKPSNIVVWLDNDNWRVIKNRHKIKNILQSLLPNKVSYVTTKSDAKKYNDKEILEAVTL